jgi:hypothetical protein
MAKGARMSAWILIVSWAVSAGVYENNTSTATYRAHAVAMQEFNDLKSCQFANIEAQKITPGIRVVCVPKGIK